MAHQHVIHTVSGDIREQQMRGTCFLKEQVFAPLSSLVLARVIPGPLENRAVGCDPVEFAATVTVEVHDADRHQIRGNKFFETFVVTPFDPDITLGEAIVAKGGGDGKVARHGTAALLNVCDPAVDYPFTQMQVLDAMVAGNVDALATANELSDTCPALD